MQSDAGGLTLRDKITFRISPLLDLALSLLVLQNPERFGEQPWMKRVQERVPAEVLAELERQAEQVDLFALALDLDQQPTPPPEVFDKLGRTQVPPALPEKAGPGGSTGRPESAGQQDSAGHPGNAAQPKNATTAQANLAAPLRAYWEALAPEVAAQAGRLAASLQEESRRLQQTEPASFIARFSDRVSVAGDGDSLILHWGKGMRVPLADLDRILFVPSAFCPRRLMFYRVGRMQIFFYAPQSPVPPEAAEVPESLLLGFSALADATRLKLLRLLQREQLPAQEMARRLELNESTVSRHLRILVEAGLLGRSRQEGKFIFYSVNLDRLERLLRGARTYLTGE